MKIAIVGSREYPHLYRVMRYIERLPKDTIIISGGAIGVDTIAEKAADKLGMKKKIFKPDYKKYGDKVAPLKRNIEIVEECEMLVAFWDGVSTGTLHAISEAVKRNKKVTIIGVVPPKKETLSLQQALQYYSVWSCPKSKLPTNETIEVLANRYQASQIVIEKSENGRVGLYFRENKAPDIILTPPQCELCNEKIASTFLHKLTKIIQICDTCKIGA